MFLADYHTHSGFSFDTEASVSVSAMLRAAEERGLRELCVTDHCDFAQRGFDGEAYWRMLAEEHAKNKTAVKLLRGIEIGEGHRVKKAAGAVLAAHPYDFVIGSIHMLRNELDFYYIKYDSEAQCYKYLDKYWAETMELCEWGGFDVLGHICYPLRYMKQQGFALPDVYERYETPLIKLFDMLCQNGKGVELNLAGLYRKDGSPTLPTPDVLALYRRRGGEIVTLGSDAHRAENVGAALEEGLELLRAAGFSYVTAFEGRKPRFERI